ncbi:MAG: TerB family tellurite resistance protein [Alteromonadaceae bacterium]|nr:TerB family tellurite resistance protein [Alteromonadaceae bacterium]
MRFESFLRALDMGKCEDQLQRETLLDIALLFVAIDGRITDSETAFIDDWLSGMPWNGESNKDEYVAEALEKVQKTISDNNIENFIAHHANQLVDAHLREQAVQLANDIANVDGDLDETEANAIEMLKSYLS